MIKTSGEYFEFSKNKPGLVIKDKIIGRTTKMSKKVEIKRAEVKKIRKHSDGRIFEIIDKEGKTYQAVGMAKEEDDKFIIFSSYASSEYVSIPLSEVKSLHIKMEDLFLTALCVAGVIGIFAVLLSDIHLEQMDFWR